jgi:hypothetical protein
MRDPLTVVFNKVVPVDTSNTVTAKTRAIIVQASTTDLPIAAEPRKKAIKAKASIPDASMRLLTATLDTRATTR